MNPIPKAGNLPPLPLPSTLHLLLQAFMRAMIQVHQENRFTHTHIHTYHCVHCSNACASSSALALPSSSPSKANGLAIRSRSSTSACLPSSPARSSPTKSCSLGPRCASPSTSSKPCSTARPNSRPSSSHTVPPSQATALISPSPASSPSAPTSFPALAIPFETPAAPAPLPAGLGAWLAGEAGLFATGPAWLLAEAVLDAPADLRFGVAVPSAKHCHMGGSRAGEQACRANIT
eukprot:1148834-Pelagomonas_calceolata.AAC.2